MTASRSKGVTSRKAGGRFSLRNVKPLPLETLVITGLNRVFEIEDREQVLPRD